MPKKSPLNTLPSISDEKKRILDRIRACMPDDMFEFTGVEGMGDCYSNIFAHWDTLHLLRICAFYKDEVPGVRVAVSGLLQRKFVHRVKDMDPRRVNEVLLEQGRGYGVNTRPLKQLIDGYCDFQKPLSDKLGEVPRYLILRGFFPQEIGPNQLVERVLFKKGPIEVELKYPIQNTTILIRLKDCTPERIAEFKKASYRKGGLCRVTEPDSEIILSLHESKFCNLPEVLDLINEIIIS